MVQILLYLSKLREGGGAVSARIAISTAKGILLACDKAKLEDYRGPIALRKPWAHSMLNRGYVQRKASTALSKYNECDFSRL